MARAEEHHGRDHGQGEPHPHGAGESQSQDHEHAERAGWLDRLRHPFGDGHSHDPAQVADAQLEASRHGQRALLVSVLGLGATALLQALVVWLSGSVALLGDTLHNFADALTAVPLAVAFRIGRRPATRRYTYGYGRAEDLAGITIVVFIAASCALAAFEAVQRLRHPADVRYLGAVAAAALVGLGITGAILAVGWDAARQVYRRLMDAVDPSLVERVEQVLRATPGVLGVGELRLRWIGHRLRAECAVVVDHHLTVVEGHQIAEEAEHRLLHQVPRLTAALVHADPVPHQGTDYHELTGPHTGHQDRPER